mmetsp:Transcript_117790/g.345057  ORF Transcript_117790/g.345057 Transcript_117790/m.345057 type:complete len:227 (+) Transcript_117790:833-1513(+)
MHSSLLHAATTGPCQRASSSPPLRTLTIRVRSETCSSARKEGADARTMPTLSTGPPGSSTSMGRMPGPGSIPPPPSPTAAPSTASHSTLRLSSSGDFPSFREYSNGKGTTLPPVSFPLLKLASRALYCIKPEAHGGSPAPLHSVASATSAEQSLRRRARLASFNARPSTFRRCSSRCTANSAAAASPSCTPRRPAALLAKSAPSGGMPGAAWRWHASAANYCPMIF